MELRSVRTASSNPATDLFDDWPYQADIPELPFLEPRVFELPQRTRILPPRRNCRSVGRSTRSFVGTAPFATVAPPNAGTNLFLHCFTMGRLPITSILKSV